MGDNERTDVDAAVLKKEEEIDLQDAILEATMIDEGCPNVQPPSLLDRVAAEKT